MAMPAIASARVAGGGAQPLTLVATALLGALRWTFRKTAVLGQELGESLERRGIPYVIYSGFSQQPEGCKHGVFIPKPAAPEQLIDVVRQIANVNQNLIIDVLRRAAIKSQVRNKTSRNYTAA
jgi:hypothetical protein